MDLVSKIKKVSNRQEYIDIQEAFDIYNLLRARYVSIQTVQLFTNFVHDVDWEIIMDGFQKHFSKQIDILEKLGRKFKIIMPAKPPLDIKFESRINSITDEYIYKKIYHDLIAQLTSLTYAIRSASTNDYLRGIIIEDLKIHLEDFDILYKFGKLKGWEEAYPVFKTSTPHKEEPLSTSEAYHIWEHINLRYEQIELIALFINFAHDTEFKVILQHGLYIFNKQVSHLEQLALKFNVPLSNRPSQLEATPIDPETIKDKFMYRNILSWELTSLDYHVRAIIETIRNDQLRKLWTEFLETEMEFYDKYLKYGKLKGWIRVVPIFAEPVT